LVPSESRYKAEGNRNAVTWLLNLVNLAPYSIESSRKTVFQFISIV